MRKILILLLLPAFVTGQPNSHAFKITVKSGFLKTGEKLYLEYENSSDLVNPERRDSILFEKDSIVLKGDIQEPVPARLLKYDVEKVDTASRLKLLNEIPLPEDQKAELRDIFFSPVRTEIFEFFLMPGETIIQFGPSFRTAKIDGSKPVFEFEQLKKADEGYINKHSSYMDDLREMVAHTKKDKAYEEKMMKKVDSLNKMKLDDVWLSYVRANPASPLALYALEKGLPPKIDSADKYLALFSALSAEIQQWTSAKKLLSTLRAAKNTEIGRFMPDFQQLDSLGRIVKFSSFKGKYILLEFWASWCGPCRMKNPELLTIYNKYSKEKFTILGIALEEKDAKEKWLKAIQKDKLKWPQVTDFKYWDNSVAKQFGIRAIPFNLLVDPDGRIVGKNLYGEELDNRLAEIFKKLKAF